MDHRKSIWDRDRYKPIHRAGPCAYVARPCGVGLCHHHIATQFRYSYLVLLGCSSGQLITGITTNVSLNSIVHSTLSFVDLYALSRSPFLFALIALQTNHFVPLLAILVGLPPSMSQSLVSQRCSCRSRLATDFFPAVARVAVSLLLPVTTGD